MAGGKRGWTLATSETSHFFIYGIRIGELWLFVGRRAHSVWEIQKLILRSVALALCITIPIAFLGVVTLARQASRRVDAIAIAMDEYLQGNLSRTRSTDITRGRDRSPRR